MKGSLRLSLMEMKLFVRERQAVFWTFVFPIMFLWIFGEMFGSSKVGGMSYIDAYAPAWIGVEILTLGIFTIGTTLATYRHQGVLRRLRATPVSAGGVLTSHLGYALGIYVLSVAVIVVFGRLSFHLSMPAHPLSVVVSIVLGLFALLPFGLFLSSTMKNPRTAAGVGTVVFNIMIFLSGSSFPMQMMPHFLRNVAHALPLYYVINLLQNTWNFTSIGQHMLDVYVLLGIGVVSAVLAGVLFRWTEDAA
jgi:ABC-2 type transport system permease protein